MTFSHSLLWGNPPATLAFFSLMMSLVSVWVYRSGWLWGSFLTIAVALALHAKVITPIALIPLLLLFLIYSLLRQSVKGATRAVLVAAAITISTGLWFHLFPGFHNWVLADKEVLSAGAVPYTLVLNFDKPFVGIFVLAWGLPLIRSRAELLRVAERALPLSAIAIAIMIGLGLFAGVVKWDPKVPTMILIWSLENLLLVTIPEEVFCRGFVQEELFGFMGRKGFLAGAGAVFLTALYFMVLHFFWVRSIPFLALVFLAGIIYGSIYQYTRAIESSIFCHFSLNWIHFVFFTYPALAR